jgi:hypothetical protein
MCNAVCNDSINPIGIVVIIESLDRASVLKTLCQVCCDGKDVLVIRAGLLFTWSFVAILVTPVCPTHVAGFIVTIVVYAFNTVSGLAAWVCSFRSWSNLGKELFEGLEAKLNASVCIVGIVPRLTPSLCKLENGEFFWVFRFEFHVSPLVISQHRFTRINV